MDFLSSMILTPEVRKCEVDRVGLTFPDIYIYKEVGSYEKVQCFFFVINITH